MYPNEPANKSSGEKNLEEFLHSLYPDINTPDHAFSRPFRFFQDMLITSALSPNLISFFCIFFYIALDFLIIFSFPMNKWFIEFVPSDDIKEFSYVAARTAVQALTAIFTILVIHLIAYQWISIAIYDPIEHLTPLSATFLHLCFGYLPQVMALILGLLLGCNILCNTYTSYATDFSTFLSISAGMTFLFFAIGYYAFYLFTRFSLFIRRGFFSVFELPFGIMSMMVFFAAAAFFPFFGTEFKVYGTIQSIILIIWGLGKLLERHTPVHVSALANVIETKVFIDAFIFPIFSILCTWIDFKVTNIYALIQTLYLLTCFIAALIVSKSYTFVRTSIQDNNRINQDKFTTPATCLMSIRIGIIYAMQPFFQLDYLKWCLLWRFSPGLVPDIVRLAFVMKKSLKEFKIPLISLSPFDLISMKFLAFQVRQYEQFISSSVQLPSISQLYEEAERRVQHVETMSNNIWTDKDYEQLSLEEYGREVYKIQQYIQNLAMLFPHIKEIQELWTNFVKISIRRPSKAVINKIHPYAHIECGGDSIYFFLNSEMPESLTEKREKKVDSTTDHFISAYVKSSRRPILAVAIVSLVIISIFGIILASFFGIRTKKCFEQFSYHTRLLALSLSLCIDAVNGADRSIILPLAPYISNELKIPLDEAIQYHNPIFIREAIYDGSSNFLSYFDYNQTAQSTSSLCPTFTLGLLLNMDFVDNSDVLIRTCHMLWASLYANLSIYEIRNNYDAFIQYKPLTMDSDLKYSVYQTDVFQAGFIVVLAAVLFIVMLLVYSHQMRKVRKLRKSIENIIALKSEITERGEPNVSFSFARYIIRCLLVLISLILMFVAYVYRVEEQENDIKLFAMKATILCDLARYSTFALTAALNEINIRQKLNPALLNQERIITTSPMKTIKEDDLAQPLLNISHYSRFLYANSLSEAIHNLNMNADDNKFLSLTGYLNQLNQSIHSVDNYSLTNIIVDFSQFMLVDEMNYNDYSFLMARLMYKDHIISIITDIFPRIASMSDMVKDYDSEPFWIYFVLILWFLFISVHLIFFLLRRQKSWFFGISVLIRRAMAIYPERLLSIIGEILEDKPNFLDGVPMPILIRDNKGIIVYANQKVTQYTKHSIDQTIGQPFSEFFTDNSAKYSNLSFSMEIRPFMDRKTQKKVMKKVKGNQNEIELQDLNSDNQLEGNYDFIVLRDISIYNELENRLKSLKDRITPDVGQLPSTGKLIFIECRFQTEKVNPSIVFSKIESISERYKEHSEKEVDSNDNNLFDSFDQNGNLNNKCITIISCGASYLNAIARIGCEHEAIQFAVDLSDGIFMNFRASITYGVASVFSLMNNDSNIVVAGDVSFRATEMTTMGVWGRIYVDSYIVSKSGMQEEIDNQKFEEEPNDQSNAKLAKYKTQAELPPSGANLNLNPISTGLGKFGLPSNLLKTSSAPPLPQLKKCLIMPVSPLTQQI